MAIKFPSKKTHGALLLARETNSVQPLYLFTKSTTVMRNVPWEEAMIVLSRYRSVLSWFKKKIFEGWRGLKL